MFEQVLLDRAAQRRSKWSWLGLVIQLVIVTLVVIVPMMHPEMLSVMMPKASIFVPSKPVTPVEVEAQQAASRPSSANTVAVARPAVRPFTAPRSMSNPVNMIVDDPGMPFVPIGTGSVLAGGFDSGLAPVAGVVTPSAPPPPKPPAPKVDSSKPVRVGGVVQPPVIIRRANPVYPPLAKQARVSGKVKLEGIIAKDGTVQHLKVIEGHPLLTKAALDAVAQWLYKPTLLNNEPVEVIAPIEVNFILN